MKILYMDNYRGFRNTFLPLSDVNFFIGDNSTGKTSVISLINLLSSNNFAYFRDFNTDEVQLGAFEDIVNTTYQKHFTIGYIRSYWKASYKLPATQVFSMLLMRFKRGTGGKCSLSEYVILKNKILYKFKNSINSGNLKIKFIEPTRIKDRSSTEMEQFFKEQVALLNKRKVYKDLPKDRAVSVLNDFMRFFLPPNGRHSHFSPINLSPKPLYDSSIWVPPIRTSPKRFYEMILSSSSEDQTPYLLNRLYQHDEKDSKEKILTQEIEQAAEKASLFKRMNLKRFNKNDSAPFSIEAEISEGNPINIFYLGYGVSQSLPVITQIITSPSMPVLLIQQPEVHLHPKAQAAIGDLIFEKATKENKQFIVETHSDFIIDRFRLAQKDSTPKANAQVVFFSRVSDHNELSIISIEKNGLYSNKQPKDFRAFFINESMKLLEL